MYDSIDALDTLQVRNCALVGLVKRTANDKPSSMLLPENFLYRKGHVASGVHSKQWRAATYQYQIRVVVRTSMQHR